MGQVWNTTRPGELLTGQVLVALALTLVPVHLSLPLAVTVEVTKHMLLDGTV